MSIPRFLFSVNNRDWNITRQEIFDNDTIVLSQDNFTFYCSVSKRSNGSYYRTSGFNTIDAQYRKAGRGASELVVTPCVTLEIVAELDPDDPDESYLKMYVLRDLNGEIHLKTADYNMFYTTLFELFSKQMVLTPESDEFDAQIYCNNYIINISSGNISLEIHETIEGKDYEMVIDNNTIYIETEGQDLFQHRFESGILTSSYKNGVNTRKRFLGSNRNH